jgi:GTP cyclohydrolase I
MPVDIYQLSSEEGLIDKIIHKVGDDPLREGLIDTPKRVVKSWSELYSGYGKDPKDILTTFDAAGHDQMVLLKNIELYSMCEHHMLPFFGKAHVAYIPKDKIIGISKLARLVDIYARRLQIQERIGDQIVESLMEHLDPKGAACIIEAQHLCMIMRGIQKQNSIMVTSSLRGAFTSKKAREELMLRI